MIKPKVLIFSKTRWSECPKLMHQFANLLKENGYKVILFENPSLRFWFSIYKQEDILFIRYFELIHHRLRFFKSLIELNVKVCKFFIRKALKKLNNQNASVVNLNYDYYFSKDLLDANINTIIAENFVDKLKDGCVKTQTAKQLGKTSQNSTINLAVSYPIKKQLEQLVDNTELFFLWAEEAYKNPENGKRRNVVLFFGYINYRIDWPLVLEMIKEGVKFRFIGSIEKSVKSKYLSKARESKNVEVLGPMDIGDIDFSDICCSILPWDTSFEGIQAITINNKCCNLLAHGLPQLYADLPHLLNADYRVISRCKTAQEFIERVNYFSDNFEDCQQPIREFLENHYAKHRVSQLEYCFKNE